MYMYIYIYICIYVCSHVTGVMCMCSCADIVHISATRIKKREKRDAQ